MRRGVEGGGGGEGEWEMQKRESPDFRFPEVGISTTAQKSVIPRMSLRAGSAQAATSLAQIFPDNKDMR